MHSPSALAENSIATGEKPRKRNPETRSDLTAQEAQIAQLAREGYSNPEIGAQLFLSPRTVEWHMRKVFAKLDISSRRQLDTALGENRRRRCPRRARPLLETLSREVPAMGL